MTQIASSGPLLSVISHSCSVSVIAVGVISSNKDSMQKKKHTTVHHCRATLLSCPPHHCATSLSCRAMSLLCLHCHAMLLGALHCRCGALRRHTVLTSWCPTLMLQCSILSCHTLLCVGVSI